MRATQMTPIRFYQTPIGKKVVMAITGAIMFGFLIAHVLGNLQIFSGAEKINEYSKMIHHLPGPLWTLRLVMIGAVVLHVISAVLLYRQRDEARPIAYVQRKRRSASLASAFMLWTGYALAAFIVFHILHFTTGTVHNDFRMDSAGNIDVFYNVMSAFSIWWVALIYIVAMVFLALHLYHGLWSFTQSLGISHPRYTVRIKTAATVVAVVLAAAFAMVPLAVITQLVSQ